MTKIFMHTKDEQTLNLNGYRFLPTVKTSGHTVMQVSFSGELNVPSKTTTLNLPGHM